MHHFFINGSKKLMMLYLSLFWGLFACTASDHHNTKQVKSDNEKIVIGAEQLKSYLPLLKGKSVGLVVNQTSQIANKHLVDVLITNRVNVQAIFAPEHGFRGDHDAGEKFSSSIDEKTGIPLISIYGKNRKPSASIMENLDVVIFDIQDVGVRFYTYISSMHYMMESASDAGINFIVLDRPNPNGTFVDGPMLEAEFMSFVGMHKIPLMHGMTVAELARMFKGEGWLKSSNDLNLTVVAMKNYQRTMPYSLPIKPSPNLPNDVAINLYPSLGFFEATPLRFGRGTDFPFQVIGHDKISLGNFKFMPISTPGAASRPKLMNKRLTGDDLRQQSVKGIDLSYIIEWHQEFQKTNTPFFTRASFMDKLSGTDKLRKAIVAGQTQQEIKQSWQSGLLKFRRLRTPYLLY
jgi:uncharacterized protein YbbC (DUF1343 family)